MSGNNQVKDFVLEFEEKEEDELHKNGVHSNEQEQGDEVLPMGSLQYSQD